MKLLVLNKKYFPIDHALCLVHIKILTRVILREILRVIPCVILLVILLILLDNLGLILLIIIDPILRIDLNHLRIIMKILLTTSINLIILSLPTRTMIILIKNAHLHPILSKISVLPHLLFHI